MHDDASLHLVASSHLRTSLVDRQTGRHPSLTPGTDRDTRGMPRRNRRGDETRLRILEAALGVLDDMDLSELLGLLPTRAVATEAGRSERAVRHHFPTAAHFRRALAELRTERGEEPRIERTAPVGARLESRATDDDVTTWAIRCAPLFTNRPETVTWSELSNAANVDAGSLRVCFGNRSVLAAVGFARHLPRLDAVLTRQCALDTQRSLVDMLCEIARSVRDDPYCAAALLATRLESNVHSTLDLGTLVPLDDRVSTAGTVPTADARRMVDTCLTLGRAQPRTAPGMIASWAMRVA